MMNWILMDVVQPRKIRFFERKVGFPILEPDFAARRTVEAIHFRGGDGMEVAHERWERARVAHQSYEMVVVGEERPGLGAYSILVRKRLKVAKKKVKVAARLKYGILAVGRGSDDIGSR